MRILFLIGFFLVFLIMPAYAQTSCTETRTITIKIYDKLLNSYDTYMPMLFQDPVRSVKFHLFRSTELYQQAKKISQFNPGKTIRLAVLGQHHLTLLEQNIRQLQNPEDVPFTQILSTLRQITELQNEILSTLTPECTAPIIQLQSFEARTESVIKKLYYESLLP